MRFGENYLRKAKLFCLGNELCSRLLIEDQNQAREQGMKIAFLTQYYPPEIGAPQNRLSQLAARFAHSGHDVSVLTAMPNYPEGKTHPGYKGVLRRERLDGVSVIRTYIYPTQSAGYVRRLTNYFSFVVSSALGGMALLTRADYLFVESPPLFLGLTGFLLSRVKRMRLIFNVSDLWPESAVRLGFSGRRVLRTV